MKDYYGIMHNRASSHVEAIAELVDKETARAEMYRQVALKALESCHIKTFFINNHHILEKHFDTNAVAQALHVLRGDKE